MPDRGLQLLVTCLETGVFHTSQKVREANCELPLEDAMAAKPAKEVWVVTWTPSTASAIGGRIVPSKPERKIFGAQKTAVSFVMNKLDERFRGTAKADSGHFEA